MLEEGSGQAHGTGAAAWVMINIGTGALGSGRSTTRCATGWARTQRQTSACRSHVGARLVRQACQGSPKRGCVTIRGPSLVPGEARRESQEGARPVVRSPRPEKGETGHILDQGGRQPRWGRDPRVRDFESGFFHCQQNLGKRRACHWSPVRAAPGGDSSPSLRR